MGRGEKKSDTLAIFLRILSSKHEVREHYRIYDGNSYIADFGGFLGLLLGHSLFGMYCLVENWIFAGLNRVFQGKKPVKNNNSGAKDWKRRLANSWTEKKA